MASSVNLVLSVAPLLSGRSPQECQNATDITCSGGVAAVDAHARNATDPTLVLPFIDRSTSFVQMHALGWALNRVILKNLLGYPVFLAPPSLLAIGEGSSNNERQDLSLLQTPDFPLLLTNAAIPPENTWAPFARALHFDESTGLAVLVVVDSGETYSSTDQVAAAIGALEYVARRNRLVGCTPLTDNESLLSTYVNLTSSDDTTTCFVPVVVYTDVGNLWSEFLSGVTTHTNPPALIIESVGYASDFESPTLLRDTWVVSKGLSTLGYYEFQLTVDRIARMITNVTLEAADLRALPEELKDEVYTRNLDEIGQLAQQAAQNDPIIGQSTEMPVARVDNYRRCKAGECEIGNLFTDALRWEAEADVAFITSGGLRGSGWPEGNVRTSMLWDALPFPNTLCTGTMSGVSLFRVFNHSMATSTFEGADTADGGNLLQVSGVRVTYNTQLEGSRLVDMEVWNEAEQAYRPVERLSLYKFATDNFLCESNDPYPELLGSELLNIVGEEPGTVSDLLHHEIVASYMRQLDTPYQATIQGRLVNDTAVTETLNFIESETLCQPGTYWIEDQQTCVICPESNLVGFSRKGIELDLEKGTAKEARASATLFNSEQYDVAVTVKSLPPWVQLVNATLTRSSIDSQRVPLGRGTITLLPSGSKLLMDLVASPENLEVGTATSTLSFDVNDRGAFPGCQTNDEILEILVRVSPPRDLNHLGKIRILGFCLCAVAMLASIGFAVWVQRHKKKSVVSAMQPLFLTTLCVGLTILATSLIPLSIDDEIASDRGCDIACMSLPWLLGIGFNVTFAALFSKLWRINKLFHLGNFRRRKVDEKDVLAPFAILFSLNFGLLLSWTLVDPLLWTRQAVAGEPWNTFGMCQSSGAGGTTFAVLVSAVNIAALALTCWQAYKARTISDDFSESKSLGIAIFGWVELLAIGGPVLFLISDENNKAKFFLQTLLIWAVCMSMPLFIFVPIVFQLQDYMSHSAKSRRKLRVSVSTNAGSVYQQNGTGGSVYQPSGISGLPNTSSNHDPGVRFASISGISLPSHMEDPSEVSNDSLTPTPTNRKSMTPLVSEMIPEESIPEPLVVDSDVTNPDDTTPHDEGSSDAQAAEMAPANGDKDSRDVEDP